MPFIQLFFKFFKYFWKWPRYDPSMHRSLWQACIDYVSCHLHTGMHPFLCLSDDITTCTFSDEVHPSLVFAPTLNMDSSMSSTDLGFCLLYCGQASIVCICWLYRLMISVVKYSDCLVLAVRYACTVSAILVITWSKHLVSWHVLSLLVSGQSWTVQVFVTGNPHGRNCVDSL